MLKRTLTTSARSCTASTPSTSSPPNLRRTKDPLLSSPTAQHFTLPSGSQFIIRAPPSSLPPTLPYSSLSPSGGLRHASAAPFLTNSLGNGINATTSEHLLPPSRPSNPPHARLSAEDIAQLQALRVSNPVYWTRSNLGKKFSVPAEVVGTLGWGTGSQAKAAEKERKVQVTAAREGKEGSWGWKKAIAREERRRRRTLW